MLKLVAKSDFLLERCLGFGSAWLLASVLQTASFAVSENAYGSQRS